MRNPERIDICLKQIEKVWKEHPDLRFGQVLAVMKLDGDIFYTEDNILFNLDGIDYFVGE